STTTTSTAAVHTCTSRAASYPNGTTARPIPMSAISQPKKTMGRGTPSSSRCRMPAATSAKTAAPAGYDAQGDQPRTPRSVDGSRFTSTRFSTTSTPTAATRAAITTVAAAPAQSVFASILMPSSMSHLSPRPSPSPSGLLDGRPLEQTNAEEAHHRRDDGDQRRGNGEGHSRGRPHEDP